MRRSDSAVWRPTENQALLDGRIRAWAAAQRERTAVIMATEKVSYGQLVNEIDRMARGMRSIGIGRGDRVVVYLANTIGFLTSFFALSSIGAVPVLIPPRPQLMDVELLRRISTETNAVAWIVPPAGEAFYRAVWQITTEASFGLPLRLLVDGPAAARCSHAITLDEIAEIGAGTGEGELPDSADSGDADGDDAALYFLSEGRSGVPRLVSQSAEAVLAVSTAMAELAGLDAESTYLAVLPVTHHFALMCPGVLGTLACGGTVLMAGGLELDGVPVSQLKRVTHVALTPALAQRWVEAGLQARHGLMNVHVVQLGGARPSPLLTERLTKRLGGRLQQVFSMAEGPVFCTRLTDPPDVTLHTQGRMAIEACDFRVVDEQCNPLPSGVYGELLVRKFMRRIGRAPEDEALLDAGDEYIRTGDCALIREDGNLVFGGCVADLPGRHAGRVPTSEVEAWLTVLSGVTDIVVVRIPDDTGKEKLCAFMRMEDEPDLAAMRAALRRSQHSGLALPDQLELIHQWPLGPSGNIDRTQLVEIALRRRGRLL